MDQDFTDLVRIVGVFALFRVVAIQEKLLVTIFDDAFGVPLDFGHDAKGFRDLEIECLLIGVMNDTVGVCAGVPIFNEFGIASNLAVIAVDELEKSKSRTDL